MYNAVNNSHYTNPDELEIVTLEDAIYLSMKNDLSFIISSILNLYEHQSTVCPNMPLRGLFYITKQFQGLIADNFNAIYSSRLIKLPTPQYIVFYNGEQKQPERQTLKLSDAFENNSVEPCLECTANVININYNHNQKLLSACKTLQDYAILIEKIRVNRKNSTTITDAINQAIDQCIADNILKEFLSKHRAEVIEMILSQYDEEAYIKLEKEYSYEDGYAQAQKELQPIIQEQNSQIHEQTLMIQQLSQQLQQLQQELEQLKNKA